MQRARFSVRAEPAVIGNAVGAVAVLLDFGNQDAAADRVQRSGFDEEYIALVGWDGIDHLGEGVVLDPAAEFFLCDLMGKAVNQRCARHAVHHIPHFGLSVFMLHPPGVFIVGMHLHRKLFRGVDQLDEHRKAVKRLAVRSQRGFSRLLQVLRQRHSGRFTVCDQRRTVRVAGKLPCFGNLFQIALHAELRFQPCSSP